MPDAVRYMAAGAANLLFPALVELTPLGVGEFALYIRSIPLGRREYVAAAGHSAVLTDWLRATAVTRRGETFLGGGAAGRYAHYPAFLPGIAPELCGSGL